MAKASLAVLPLSRNDLSIIAGLLEQSFDYYLNHNSPFFTDYLCSLRTVAGLGFAAALADESLLTVYQHYLSNFLGQARGDFREARGAKTMIAQSTAEMVGNALISFNALRYPRYYEDFVKALHYTIGKIPELNNAGEAERILKGLTRN